MRIPSTIVNLVHAGPLYALQQLGRFLLGLLLFVQQCGVTLFTGAWWASQIGSNAHTITHITLMLQFGSQ